MAINLKQYMQKGIFMTNNSTLASFSQLIILLFILNLLTACASGVSKSVKVTDDDIAKYNVMTPDEALSSLEKQIQTAKDQNLPLYTPSHYKEAETLFNTAKKDIEKKKKKVDIIHKIAKADRILAKAHTKKKDVESELGELLTVHRNLIKLETPKVFTKDYKTLKKELTALTVKVEKNKANKIEKNKNKLLKKFIALEVRSIKYAALHEADEIKAQAKQKKALKLAPKTYANAVTVYQESEALISQDPHNNESVKKASETAIFAAKHALNVTERVIELQKQYKKSPETIIIAEENRILDISKTIDNSDFRDQPINEQVSSLIKIIEKLINEKQSNENSATTIAAIKKELKEKEESHSSLNKELEKTKTDLADRNNQLIKMTADLIHLQNKEKKHLLEIDQLKKITTKTSNNKSDTNKEIKQESETSDKSIINQSAIENQPALKQETLPETKNSEKTKPNS